MRKILGIAGLAAVALVVWAQSGSSVLSSVAKTLNSAESLHANYTIQRIGGTKEEFTISLAKPNKARIDTSAQLIVADGNSITTFDKAAKTYYKKPQTEQELKAILGSDEFSLWQAFFDGSVYAKTPSKTLGVKNRKGMNLTAVETAGDNKGKKTTTLYVSQDNITRQAEIVLVDGADRVSYVVDTKSVTLGGGVGADAFAFKAPEGSRELKAEEIDAGKWYTNLEEAKKVAAATNRMLLVDFYADW